MSKVSGKVRYQQLKEWMDSRGKQMSPSTNNSRRKFSKSDHYKKTR